MAEATASRSVFELPGLRQLFLLVGLAAAIAAGLWLVFWSQGPNFATLYSQLSERETAQVVDALQAAGIPHKLDGPSGTVRVPEPQLREARMRLAAQGLPQSDALGVEMIQKDNGFGTSQFMETARYQLAIETELARTIVKVQGVQGARVHLALPHQSAFVRDKRHATASVMLQLYPGRRLEPGQVTAIAHLVASSVPDLETHDITVVDQNGTLLSSPDGNDALAISAKQLEYTKSVEDGYTRRIEQLLTPLVGAGRVRAGVTADIDYTVTEQSSENYDPQKQVVRSEQTANEQRMAGDIAMGIPGALSNQPPQTTPAPPAAKQQPAPAPPQPVATNNRATRNFEIDRTVSHVLQPTGTVRRLSVAVIVDNKQVVGADGKAASEPLTDKEIERYTNLVREAVGFDEKRGDRVEVINASFSNGAAGGETVAEEPWYANPLFKQLARQGVAVLAVAVLALVVLRPIMKTLLAPPRGALARLEGGAPGDLARDKVTLSGGAAGQPQGLPNYEQHVAAARSVITQDPKRAAQVVKEWVTADG
ncbi:MAG TPA: flagellar basal-body MS-ring/collar protein FliF [Steroidobacteraceae bacterium]|nr:flagellar basal-body MS-ring/collar protein FliF [Steroidobacteraceae bacterium]